MAIENTPIITTTSIKVQVDIAFHENGECSGELFSVLLNESYKFNCIMKMLTKMEAIFDEQNCPENYTQLRTFSEVMSKGSKKEVQRKVIADDAGVVIRENADMANNAKKGTFEISVKFRQNATWQGEILWAEKNVKQNFRSVFEMLMLISEALNS